MTGFKSYYSCAELAAMKLPSLPATERNIRDKANRESWKGQKRPGRGGGYEYQPPAPIIALIRERAMQKIISEAGEIAPIKQELAEVRDDSVKPGDLKDWQRDVAQARIAICHEVRRLANAGGTEKAIQTVLKMAAAGELPERLQKQAEIANSKKGKSRALSRTTLYRWLRKTKGDGSSFARLAPKGRETVEIPPWAPYLLSLYGQPQKPSLAHCLERLPEKLPAEITLPSYSACRRFIEKMSNVDKHRGRMGSRELKKILPFVRRDTRGMWPTECYTADGHTFDAEVAHPVHGRAFRPEITTVLDVTTRKAVGWSAGLAESAWTVLDALRHACTSCGIPSIFYVDNGAGFKNDMMNNEVTGFMDRLGIELTHSLPYGSQARGIIERVQQTLWVRSAKILPTYMGKEMDQQAKQKIFKLTRKDIQISGASRHLLEWADFLQFCRQQIDDYNNRPHKSLPKVRGQDGKKRHQTPNEAWLQAADEGWQPVEVEAYERADLFRPYKTCKVIRGEVRLFGNLYFHRDLADYNGETLRVGYDIHDANHVWVRDREGRLICVAEFEANSRRYFPQSFIDQANFKRAQGRIKRAEARIEEAQAELDPPQLIEHRSEINFPPMAIRQSDDRLLSPTAEHIEDQYDATNIQPMPTKGADRPWFTTDAEKYRWLMSHQSFWTEKDTTWLLDFVHTEYYDAMEDRFSNEGIAWGESDTKFAKHKLNKEVSAAR